MRQLLAMLLSLSLIASTTACASAGRTAVTTPQPPVVDVSAMADYVTRLPAGSKVRVERVNGSSIRGTLMKADASAMVVQKNTRIAEPPVQVPLREVARVTLENGAGASIAKAVAIGIASGAGAFFAILAIAVAND